MNKNKTAWITGAGKGIGKALAKQLVKEGWTVAASSRTNQDLTNLRQECPPDSIYIFPLDVTDEAATRKTFNSIENQLGEIHLAIFNAGTHIPVTVKNFSTDAIRRTVEVNLMGTVHGLGQAIPKFIERQTGHIVVVSSLAGYRGLPTSSGYGATKAALINMCEALKPELDEFNVTLSLVCPGFIKTPLTDKNTFPMPFIISAESAASIIIKNLNKRRYNIAFPTTIMWIMKIVRILPNRLLFFLTRNLINKS